MTEVGALAGGLAWRCATLAMLASMLCRFIWPIAMETEAGARLAGIRGCDIIMKGNCSRTGVEKNKKRRRTRWSKTVSWFSQVGPGWLVINVGLLSFHLQLCSFYLFYPSHLKRLSSVWPNVVY